MGKREGMGQICFPPIQVGSFPRSTHVGGQRPLVDLPHLLKIGQQDRGRSLEPAALALLDATLQLVGKGRRSDLLGVASCGTIVHRTPALILGAPAQRKEGKIQAQNKMRHFCTPTLGMAGVLRGPLPFCFIPLSFCFIPELRSPRPSVNPFRSRAQARLDFKSSTGKKLGTKPFQVRRGSQSIV